MVCIAGDQLVSTVDGDKPIKDVEVGNVVHTSGEPCQVTASAQTGVKPTRAVTLSNGRTLRATDDHPVMVITDLCGVQEWRKVADLKPGLLVVGRYTQFDDIECSAVVSVSEPGEPEPVYDLTVKDAHNFVCEGMVVSNCKHLHILLTRRKL